MIAATATTTPGIRTQFSINMGGPANTNVIPIALFTRCVLKNRRNTGVGATATGITTATPQQEKHTMHKPEVRAENFGSFFCRNALALLHQGGT